MLRVLHVGKYYPPVTGGMERVVQTLCEVTRGRLDSRVLVFHRGASTVEEVVGSIPVTRVGTLGQAGSVPIAPALARRLARADADVMIVHEPNPWALLSMLVATMRIPLAIWFHSDVIRPRLQYRLFYAPIARPAYDRARRFVASSPLLAAASPVLSRYAGKTSIIPFGIDPDAWVSTPDRDRRAAEIRRRIDRPIILFVGRLVPYKGVDVLIKAAAPLPVHVLIAGDGPMRAAWTSEARANPGRATIELAGELPDEQVKDWMHAADVLVLPSVTSAEAFGVVQLEAMAAGKPVISTSVRSGVSWVNRHLETGLVVAPGDVDALRVALETLVSNAALRCQFGAAGAQRVRTEFTLSAMADRFVSLCTEVATTS